MALVTMYRSNGNPVCQTDNAAGWLASARYEPLNTRTQMHHVLRADPGLDNPMHTRLWIKPEDLPTP
ncbi:hypothetical protein [Ruegeria atlantica]|uniref:hypothetical protein n=1 Tax=Ruegeria atlantica TaxID=81569 RepID=UPI00147DE17D|nr:hypothetical protein [Ruegeria atlantica]